MLKALVAKWNEIERPDVGSDERDRTIERREFSRAIVATDDDSRASDFLEIFWKRVVDDDDAPLDRRELTPEDLRDFVFGVRILRGSKTNDHGQDAHT